MAIYDKLLKTMTDRDVDSYANLIHEDAVFVFHKTGNEFSKSDWMSMATGMMTNEKFVQDSSRCVFDKPYTIKLESIPPRVESILLTKDLLKDGKITIDEMTGGTFTITNGGSLQL